MTTAACEPGRKHSRPWCVTHDAPMRCSAQQQPMRSLSDKIEYALAPMSVHLSLESRREQQESVLRECLAALAQQAQPLTDEMIHKRSLDAYHATCFAQGAKWARDRMAQQAQPQSIDLEIPCAIDGCPEYRIPGRACCFEHLAPAQQAQPE